MSRPAFGRLFFVGVFLAVTLRSQTPSAEHVLQQLSRTVSFKELQVSPDGKYVAWAERVSNPDGSESRNTKILLAGLASPAETKRITAGDGTRAYAEGNLAWSPDSRTLAFTSDRDETRQPQIYTLQLGTSTPRKLTTLKGDISSLHFSPDGKSIAFLFLENAKAVGPTDAYTPELGVLESDIHEQRIAVVDAGTKAVRPVTPANLFVYEYDWSPDGQQFAYSGAEGDGDNNWWTAKLYRLDLSTGRQFLLAKPEAQIAEPHWSPDGKTIAYIGGLMSDQGVTGGDIYLAGGEGGGEPVNLTPGRAASATWLRWTGSAGKPRLLVGDLVDGGTVISEMDPHTRVAERLWQGDESVEFGGVSNDGRTVSVVRSSWSAAPEVWAGRIGSWSAITHVNVGQKAFWGKAEKLEWSNAGHRVEGWLIYPADFDASKRYPMVVSIHGGPASQRTPRWPQSDYSVLASQGMFVFFPNPRGSYGQGEAFTRANVKDFGYGDLSDILSGVDQVLKKAPVDNERLGVGGWSYGGYMTMWTVTQTQRFKAAVAGAGIANWQSYYGENLIDQWMIPYFGASVYDDPAVYAKSSPITFIKRVRTPTLIVVGDRDAECPMPQSREFWHALKTLGVETQLVVYPNEGHHFRDPSHVADLNHREVVWFKEHLKPQAPATSQVQ